MTKYSVSQGFEEDLLLLDKPDLSSYKPLVFGFKDKSALQKLLSEKRPEFHDQLKGQVMELNKIRNPQKKITAEEQELYYRKWISEVDSVSYGLYVYYPWSNKLVHTVTKEEFIELRTSRNKHKITEDEQAKLGEATVGVIGLSVGQSVALTMAMERSFGTLRIADFDTLELTNLNRIRAGVSSMGLPKTIVVAREIAEIDPFLNVEIFNEGVTDSNIEDFFGKDKPLDLLIEECDSLPIKILAREKAREMKIPVIMDTSDRGMIDVERFDKMENLPLLHGLCKVSGIKELMALDPKEQMEVMMGMVDFDNLSPRMKYSFGELGKSLSTWPQLASDVIAGGGNAAKIARMIVLGEHVPSKRYYFDVSDHMQISNEM
ncbi:ThiF family adenylyltransferase [Owenweeksia hongkongensis]|uniref:ThiF family adenylyltransferase n=1 Tax=Owenweeksia hongkongensis TaxID=253245 RepID=UPI003A90BAC9